MKKRSIPTGHMHLGVDDLNPLRQEMELGHKKFFDQVITLAISTNPISYGTYSAWVQGVNKPNLLAWRQLERYIECEFPRYIPVGDQVEGE